MSSAKSHECKDCETIFESKEEFDKHMIEEHSEDEHQEDEWYRDTDAIYSYLFFDWLNLLDTESY